MARIWVADDEPNERFPLYSRGNTGEVFPNVITALTGTLVAPEVHRGQLQVFLDIGFLSARDLREPVLGTGVFGGYLYGNASLYRLMGVRTPGMKPDSADQQGFGNIEGLPPYRPRRGDKSFRASLRLGRYLTTLLRLPDLTVLDRARTDAEAWLATMPDPATASDADLLAFVWTYPPRLRASITRLLQMSSVASGPRAILDKLLTGPSVPAGLTNRLLGGVSDVDSAQLAIGLWQLGRIVAADPELTAAFDAGLDGLADRIPGTALERPLAAFLARRGHRGLDEFELATPSWSMDPRPVYAAIDRLRLSPADRDPAVVAERLEAERLEAEAVVDRLGRVKRRIVRKAAAAGRQGSIARERAKDILVQENLGVRLVLHELMRRASARGGPADPLEGFNVTADELAAYVADPVPFLPVIAERAATQRYLAEREPPPWFEGTIPDPSTWRLRRENRASDDQPAVPTGTRSGIPVSAGRATGPARVISDPGDPRGLEPGDVLVCAITDPAWTPLFLVAAAVVCDTGALQSHAAIVARELGIPGVMSVFGITGVADGTMLTVDGNAGTVEIAPV